MKELGPHTPAGLSEADEPTLLQLAMRCEMEKPSRKLDAEISVAINWRGKWISGGWLWLDERASAAYGEPVIRVAEGKRKHMGDPPLGSYPYFTTSLDAAVGLVEEGVEWSLSNLYGIARAEVGLNLNDGSHFGEHKGALMAMALCAAALRARAAMQAASAEKAI